MSFEFENVNHFFQEVSQDPELQLQFQSVTDRESLVDLLQKKYVLSLKICSSLGQTLNYWVDWHLLKLAQPARL